MPGWLARTAEVIAGLGCSPGSVKTARSFPDRPKSVASDGKGAGFAASRSSTKRDRRPAATRKFRLRKPVTVQKPHEPGNRGARPDVCRAQTESRDLAIS